MQVCSIVSFVEKTEKCLENLVKVGAHCMYLFSFFAHLVKLMLNSNWIIWKKQKQNRNRAAGHEKYCLRLPIESIFIIFRDGFWIFIQVSNFSDLNAAALVSSSCFISWPWCTCIIRKKINKNNKIFRASEINEPIINVTLHILIVRLLVGQMFLSRKK